ncbi:CHAD domain-containing protein [Kitasatospora sp. NBC_01539]|uniref:CHAD domain-containing protein n=1 Tax=Kitasatospora sp. NBC_01539 TaxID=2903577 RepID=UPI0038601CD6
MPHTAVPPGPAPSGPTAAEVLGAWIAVQTDTLAGLAADVRADRPDAVHRMRVTCRRLRSTLQAYRPLIGADTTALTSALRALAAALGAARDTEVIAERLTAAARTLPPECGPREVVAAMEHWAAGRTVRARPEALAALDGPAFPALLAALRSLAGQPRFTARAERPALPVLARTARRQQRRVGRRLDAAGAAEPGEAVAAALHEARKAAKRARYAGEPAGAAAERFTRGMKELQDLLGAHQDAVVACGTLRGLAADDPAHAFAYGVLYRGQLDAAARERARLPEVWREADRKPRFRGPAPAVPVTAGPRTPRRPRGGRAASPG